MIINTLLKTSGQSLSGSAGRRKVRTPTGTVLPNRKVFRHNSGGTDSATENRLPFEVEMEGQPFFAEAPEGKGEKVR